MLPHALKALAALACGWNARGVVIQVPEQLYALHRYNDSLWSDKDGKTIV